jgi:hypothetical protein
MTTHVKESNATAVRELKAQLVHAACNLKRGRGQP